MLKRPTLLALLLGLSLPACDDDDGDGCYSPFCPCDNRFECAECSAFDCDFSDCSGVGECNEQRGDDASYSCVDIDHCGASCGDHCRLGCAEASSCELECGDDCDL